MKPLRPLRALARRFGYELRRGPVADSRWAEADLSLHDVVEKVEGMTAEADLDILETLARRVTDGCIVEIGAYRGRSGIALAVGSWCGSRVPVYCIDPHETFTGILGGSFGPEDRRAFYQSMIDSGAYRIVRLINLPSTMVARCWDRPIGLLWIDGDHREEAVRQDVDAWSPHLRHDALLAFDDVDDPELGPHRVVEGLLAGGEWKAVERTRKIAVLARP